MRSTVGRGEAGRRMAAEGPGRRVDGRLVVVLLVVAGTYGGC